MASKKTVETDKKSGASREDRLKSALKANLARRKAQNRTRKALDGDNETHPAASGQDKEN